MELKHKECFIPNFINHYEPAGREQVRPRGGRVREPVLEEPRDQSLSGAGRAARVAAAAARGEGPRRRGAACRRACVDWIDTRNEARQSGAGKGGGGDGRSRLEAGAGLVAWPSTSRSTRWSAACRRFRIVRECLERFAGRADMLVVSATPNEALEARMGRARPRQVRARRSAARRSAARRNRWPTPSSTRRTTR